MKEFLQTALNSTYEVALKSTLFGPHVQKDKRKDEQTKGQKVEDKKTKTKRPRRKDETKSGKGKKLKRLKDEKRKKQKRRKEEKSEKRQKDKTARQKVEKTKGRKDLIWAPRALGSCSRRPHRPQYLKDIVHACIYDAYTGCFFVH